MVSPSDLGWEEYTVFAVVLMISVSIGIFYGCFGSKQKSTKEFLMANKAMPVFPVALSMICSAISAITLLANPIEVYLYGTQYFMVVLCFIPFNLSLAYIYIPVYFNLGVNSAYEFIEERFNHTVRIITSLMAVLHVVTSMAIAVYSPALAIHQVTGLDTRLTTFVIYGVCIFYSALGGLKAVLWTDVFQAFIMLASLTAVAIKGTVDVGGFSDIWQAAEDTDRVIFFNFDPDPRVRHTIWTCVIAGYFFWIPSYGATQVQVQRFLSMPTMKRVKRALIINCVGLFVIIALCCFTGLVMVAKYQHCDPMEREIDGVENSDELVPFFVKETVGEIPGLTGLFIAGLTCASMSTLSSGLTALASITTYDYIKPLFPKFSDEKLSLISKVNTLILGALSYLFVFAVENMGSILPATSSLLGIMLGPTLGLFSLGMMVPWANAKGSITAMVATFAIMIAFVIANVTSDDLPDQSLPLSIDGCGNNTISSMHTPLAKDWRDEEYSFITKILSMSYMWYSGLGCSMTFLFGLIICPIFDYYSKEEKALVNPLSISPPVLKLFIKFFPEQTKKWVDLSEKNVEESNDSEIEKIKIQSESDNSSVIS